MIQLLKTNSVRQYLQLYSNNNNNNLSLFCGLSGDILMYYELYATSFDEKYKIYCNQLIDRLYKSFSRCRLLNFGLGYTGILYTLSYLNNQNFIDYDRSISDTLKPSLNSLIPSMHKYNNYDLQQGLIGMGIYYIEIKDSASVYNIVNYLCALAIETSKDVYWYYTGEDQQNNNFLVNLGFLHGMPSIIAFFLICYKEGYKTANMLRLIYKGLYFLEHRISQHEHCSFPNSIYINESFDNQKNYNTILGFCYGDIGITHLFSQAAMILANTHYQSIVKQLTRKIFLRISDDTEMNNPFFCHGISGIIYFLHHFRNNVSQQSQNLDVQTKKLIPYLTCQQNEKLLPSGILNGTTGIILSLLSLEKTTCFERILLLT